MLCSWPEGCRAILMASAGRNVAGSTWWQDVVSRRDARDGAGAVDAAVGRRDRPAAPMARRAGDAPRLGRRDALVGRRRVGSAGDIPLPRRGAEPDLLPDG